MGHHGHVPLATPLTLRHHELLDSAVADMLAHGAHQLKVERVARAVGIAKGTVYLSFPSRDALRDAAIERGMIIGELDLLLDDVEQHGGVTPDTVPTFVAQAWTALEERDEVLRLVSAHGFDLVPQHAREALRTLHTRLATLIRAPHADVVAASLVATIVAAYLDDAGPGHRDALVPVLRRLVSR